MRLPGLTHSRRPSSASSPLTSHSEDRPFFTWESHHQDVRITQGGGQSASLTRPLFWGLAVLAVVLAVLRFWPVSSRLPAVPATGAAHFAAASIDSTPDGRTSDDTYSPPAIPMPPPLSPHILIVHARDYPLYPVITGGDPTDGTLPVPPVRAVVRVDMPAFHTFTHPPSVPITAPSGR